MLISNQGDNEDAQRVCCMLQMRLLKLESAEKLKCISNMLRSAHCIINKNQISDTIILAIDGQQPWTVWTSARKRNNCNTPTYQWCPANSGPVNNALWSPGFPTNLVYPIPNYALRCATVRINYNNSQPITTFENWACDLLHPIVCET